MSVRVCVYKQWKRKKKEVKTVAAGWSRNQKIEMSFFGVRFLFAL